MQALMLAAGMGRRLGKHTSSCPKCMVKVGGKTLLERTAEALRIAGIKKFVVVVGYEADKLIEYAKNNIPYIDFEFIHNYDYASTNNIYSLYLAKEQLLKDDTILIESDLVYDQRLIKEVVDNKSKNLVVVAKYEHWMDGTVALIDQYNNIIDFIEKKNFEFADADKYYKTVNIYKFSKEFSKEQYVPFLDAYIKAYGKNQYYELVLKIISHVKRSKLKAFKLNNIDWYEVDDPQDLDIANTIFAQDNEILNAYNKRFGGYWRFPSVIDFCYLVNPYFPPKHLKDKMKYFFNTLLCQYPSGMYVQRINAGRLFGVYEDYVLVGNGAAEIINALGRISEGRVSLSVPSFNEYIRCFPNCEIQKIYTIEDRFSFNVDKILDAINRTDILVIVNPDNPSGSYIQYNDMIKIIEECNKKDVKCIVDESFIDFADAKQRYTLINNDILTKYKNLIVIKSISKSYGVPGLRLGIMATADLELLKKVQKEMAVWNINSFAEYFLQIMPSYKREYILACNKIEEERNIFQQKLKNISFLEIYSSQANYIMCKVAKKFTSKELASILIRDYNLLIKDLSSKSGFFKENYIRIAIRSREDNDRLYNALKLLDED
ncbi:MAG TPA: aminotransferase class I/II-fold pyridoxal phosphate-dependent enzyme [Clostridiaceae bacterium]|nr:aminotransferase class I/II-fold pyridoxal phosphate-dependent enzyme [Clostridiaceae bacterium]